MVIVLGNKEYRVVGAMNTSKGSRAITAHRIHDGAVVSPVDEQFRVGKQEAQYRVVIHGG